MKLISKNIYKIIKGKTILDNVNLNLTSGHIYGFVGHNGSGKTMLFKALSGLMYVTEGHIYLDDYELHKDIDILPGLGIMIENAGLYPELSGYENLKTLGKINKKISNDEIKEFIRLVGLNPDDRKPFRNYSLGMKQRIIFAQAIMEKPDILMLDEPTNTLDEDGVKDIRKLIFAEKERGAMVLIASHNKEDISELADVVYTVQNGNVTLCQEGKAK
jgi:ABC-2 type transport system ATP-binding protein